jgi:HAD superfamily hydrolase (TIGR01509 family)
MKCGAVLFDLGNTLLDYGMQGRYREFLPVRLAELYPLLGEGDGGRRVSAEVFAEHAAEVIGGEHNRRLMHSGKSCSFADRLRQALNDLGIQCEGQLVSRLVEEFYRPIGESASLYPDTVETLTQLTERGLRLAVISNSPWDAPGYLGLGDMQRWGIDGYFQALLFSGDLPWRKPNPEFMRAAARRLAVPLEDCIVVGDNLGADIAGANAAGIRSIWIDRGDHDVLYGRPRGVPDVTVQTLAEATHSLLDSGEG